MVAIHGRRARWLAVAVSAAALPLGVCQRASGSVKLPANGGSFGAVTYALQAKLNSQRYSEGLKIAEEGLIRFPDNPDLTYGKTLCMMGLFRNREAAELLSPLAARHPERPDFTFTLGEAWFYAGDGQSAMRTWASLFSDPVMAEKAYYSSVKALLSSGREDEARRLADEGLARLPKPSQELIRYKVDLALRASEALPLLDQLTTLDPPNASGYQALRLLYETGGDKEFNEMRPPLGQRTEEISLARTSNPRQGSTVELNMDMGGSTTTTSFSDPVLTTGASINGASPETMMLDSGSSFVFLSPQLAQRLALKPVSTVRYQGLGGAGVIESSWALLDSLQVGQAVFHNVPAVIVNPKTNLWGEFWGIIPLSLFKHQAVVYDPSGPSLKIMVSGTNPEKAFGAGGFEVKAAWFKGCPFARTAIQELSGVFCLLDTGSFSTFLAPDIVPGLYSRPDSPHWRSANRRAGLSGDFDPMVARQIRLCLGERCTILSVVQVAPIPLPYSIPCAGIIGRNILDQYVVFLDYGADRVYFKRRER